jgi:hypothetical protein
MNKEQLIRDIKELHIYVTQSKENLKNDVKQNNCSDADYLYEKVCTSFTSIINIESKIHRLKQSLTAEL